MITVENIRLTGIILDVMEANPKWKISGYYVTKADKILGSIIYSSDAADGKIGFNFFVPTDTMEKMSSVLLGETHRVINAYVERDFADEPEKVTTIKDVSPKTGNTDGDLKESVAKVKKIL